jgi:hypothetical protein
MSARTVRVPRADTAIAAALSERYRTGSIYSYSLERGVWSTWETEHDWRHTERNGQRRCACCAPEMSAAGPTDWRRDRLLSWLGLDQPAPKRITKAQLVAQLRRVPGLPAAAHEILAAAS